MWERLFVRWKRCRGRGHGTEESRTFGVHASYHHRRQIYGASLKPERGRNIQRCEINLRMLVLGREEQGSIRVYLPIQRKYPSYGIGIELGLRSLC